MKTKSIPGKIYGSLWRCKLGPFHLLNIAAYWKSSNKEASANKLSQILANSTDNQETRAVLKNHVDYCRLLFITLHRKQEQSSLQHQFFKFFIQCENFLQLKGVESDLDMYLRRHLLNYDKFVPKAKDLLTVCYTTLQRKRKCHD